MHPKNETLVEENLGLKIRDLRKRKGLTLQALAAAIGRSVGFVSQIERGLSQPAVDDLYAMSDALSVHGTYFFSGSEIAQNAWQVRQESRRTFHYARGVTEYLASPGLAGRFFMLETVLEPGADTGDRNLIDRAEQGGYVLSGELTLWLDGEAAVLRAGDSFQFGSSQACRYANQGPHVARVLWIFA
jgi:transcriptional regulator with XRE-family HTH domain